jgi:hypothetical protein
MQDFQTFGRASKYDWGTSISAKAMLFMAMEAFNIWFAHSRVWFNCFLEFSLRPPGATRGTGNHHFSSCLCIVLRKEAEPSASGATTPWSTYQNSVLMKVSNISCHRKRPNKFRMTSKIENNIIWNQQDWTLQEACCLVYTELGDW